MIFRCHLRIDFGKAHGGYIFLVFVVLLLLLLVVVLVTTCGHSRTSASIGIICRHEVDIGVIPQGETTVRALDNAPWDLGIQVRFLHIVIVAAVVVVVVASGPRSGQCPRVK